MQKRTVQSGLCKHADLTPFFTPDLRLPPLPPFEFAAERTRRSTQTSVPLEQLGIALAHRPASPRIRTRAFKFKGGSESPCSDRIRQGRQSKDGNRQNKLVHLLVLLSVLAPCSVTLRTVHFRSRPREINMSRDRDHHDWLLCHLLLHRQRLPHRGWKTSEICDVPVLSFDHGRVLTIGIDPAVDGPALAGSVLDQHRRPVGPARNTA